jgi:hypothetical protein
MPGYHTLVESPNITPVIARDQRLSLIRAIEQATGRPLIVYAGAIGNKPQEAPTQIDVTDRTAFSDLLGGIEGDSIDILLQSPGGSAEAAEQIVSLIRSRFKSVRYFVPHTATSAATLMVLSGDSVAMDDRSSLGPIDPQIIIPMQVGVARIPAHSYVQGFKKAKEAIEENPEVAPAYLPLLSEYKLYLLEVCQNALLLSRSLAEEWLREYMLKGQHDAVKKAAEIASDLSDHSKFLSHQRPIGIDKALELGLTIMDLRATPDLRDLLWQLYCGIEFHFDRTPAVKLFENSRGVSYMRQFMQMQMQIPMGMQPQLPFVSPPQIPQPVPPTSPGQK